MSYPQLVLPAFCKTPISVTIESEGYDEDGAPVPALTFSCLCNWQDSGKQVLTAQKQMVTLEAVALIPGDPAPDLAVLTGGKITAYGIERRIYRGRKCRNPDGTVNYTSLEVV